MITFRKQQTFSPINKFVLFSLHFRLYNCNCRSYDVPRLVRNRFVLTLVTEDRFLGREACSCSVKETITVKMSTSLTYYCPNKLTEHYNLYLLKHNTTHSLLAVTYERQNLNNMKLYMFSEEAFIMY